MSDVETPTPTEPVKSPGKSMLFRIWQSFWLVTLVVSLAYAWHCFYVPANSVAWADSYAAAQQQAADEDKPMILFFTGSWCVPCRIMKRKVWADEHVTATVNATFIPVMIDVDAPNATAARSRYRIGATPNTVVTDSQGNVLQQKQGGMDKAEFLDLLETSNSSASSDL